MMECAVKLNNQCELCGSCQVDFEDYLTKLKLSALNPEERCLKNEGNDLLNQSNIDIRRKICH